MPLRAELRALFLLVFWMTGTACLLWTWSSVEFFFVQPARAQRELFGRQIAGTLSMRFAIDDCCTLSGEGRVSWYYQMDEEMARNLAAAFAGRRPRRVRMDEAWAGHYRLKKPYENAKEDSGYSAEITENRLEITQDWE